MCETTTVVGMREKQFRLIHGFIISVNGGVTTSWWGSASNGSRSLIILLFVK